MTASPDKIKILCHLDSPTSTTGFGIVAKHILKALWETGKYQIDIIGINYFGSFYDMEKYPYNITPARLDNPGDPYGYNTVLQNLATGKYDIFFVINDTFVTEKIAKQVFDIRKELLAKGRPFSVVYYYPVDCRILKKFSTLLEGADFPVAYTQFGFDETVRVLPKLKDRLEIIYHGVEPDVFKELTPEAKMRARINLVKAGPEDFVVVNVNRNNVRKDLPTTIMAFAKFKKKVPKAKLYLHTLVRDNNVDLSVPVEELGLSMVDDVVFPVNYHTALGFPDAALNEVYNMANCFLTTTLGEGFGLGAIEAMSAGCPVIVPDNTVHPEIFGNGRGFLYHCNDYVYVDNSGFRKKADPNTICDKLFDVWKLWKNRSPKLQAVREAGRAFATEYSWSNVTKRWLDVFERATQKKKDISQVSLVGEMI